MGLLGETIETRRDLFVYKLGAALTMEKTVLDMLPELEEHATHDQMKVALSHHREETERHVQNLERAFASLGEDVDDSPCPVIEGLEKEGQANLKMVDDTLNDAVIASGVCETEHHEIAAYEGLIANARAMGEADVAALLEQNLLDEKSMLEKGKQMAEQIAQGMAPVA